MSTGVGVRFMPNFLALSTLIALWLTRNGCHCGIFSSFFPTRTQYYLGNHKGEADCDIHGDSPLTVDGSLKLTTSPMTGGNEGTKICRTPLQPFGDLVQDSRGIRFWFLRLRVTRLISGQSLAVVTVDKENMDSMIVSGDQRHDVTEGSRFPALLYLRYRYVRLYWQSTAHAAVKNPVNITVSRYAVFNDSLKPDMRQYLCARYGNTWCESSSVCISPGSCTLQNDCFDRFIDPNKCQDTIWQGAGNTSLSGPGAAGTWISRNLPWIALVSIPVILALALAKICSQKRELDIDDDYEFKLSCSDNRDEFSQQFEEDQAASVQTRRQDNRADERRTSRTTQARQRLTTPLSLQPTLQPPLSTTSVVTPPAPAVRGGDGQDAGSDSETGESRRTSPEGAAAVTAARPIVDGAEEVGNDAEERLAKDLPPPPPPRLKTQQQQQQQLARRSLQRVYEDEAVELQPRHSVSHMPQQKEPQLQAIVAVFSTRQRQSDGGSITQPRPASMKQRAPQPPKTAPQRQQQQNKSLAGRKNVVV